MTAEDGLRVAAGICCRAAQGLSELPESIPDADVATLLAIGREHRCLPLLAPLVPRAPTPVARELEQLVQATWASYELTVATLGPVLERAHAMGVRVVVYKGAAHAARWYREPWRRQMQDVDMLLEPEGLRVMQRLLAAAGYQDLIMPRRARSTELSHERSMVNQTAGVRMVDLHVHPAPPLRYPFDREQMFSRARPLQIFGAPALVLCDEDELIVASVNQAYDHFRGSLLRAVDGTLMIARRAIDWELVLAAADQAEARAATWLTLRWMRDLAGADVPGTVVASLRPSLARTAWLAALLGPPERPWPRFSLPRRLEQALLTFPLMDHPSTFLSYTARHSGRRLIDAWRARTRS